ncbi:hypothetical protein [Mycolicibacterium fortuitum]|uniref:hypothetical protein n=1 Tax=Mycolicibacterium fortuitum TaxID=1766 RepID=UPI0026257269|nr:hypothetical protein [Mycolicibacterium fortuitum]
MTRPDLIYRESGGVHVGVIGVAAPRTLDLPYPARSSWLAMEDYVALLDDRTPMYGIGIPVSVADPAAVASAITSYPWPLSAVFVVGLAESGLAEVARLVTDPHGPLVLGEADVVAVASAAAVLSVLGAQALAPPDARVVVGGDTPRFLGPLLIACGIGELTTWRPRDAHAYPLARLMTHNDVLITAHSHTPVPPGPARTVAVPADPFEFGALVVPGLLSALCGHGVTTVDTGHLAAAARAVAALAPEGQMLPELNDPRLVGTIARQVSEVIAHRPR